MDSAVIRTDAIHKLLRDSDAIKEGHFALPSGIHTNLYFSIPLAMRYYNNWKTLCVALSRILRVTGEVSTALPKVVIVAPDSGGIPIAFGVRETLQADQICWVERKTDNELAFRRFTEVKENDSCILVDDVLYSGRTLKELIQLVEKCGARVISIGVLVDARHHDIDFGPIPVHSLLKYDPQVHPVKDCPLCRDRVPLTVL